jgi:hypothetical protein
MSPVRWILVKFENVRGIKDVGSFLNLLAMGVGCSLFLGLSAGLILFGLRLAWFLSDLMLYGGENL